MTEINFKSAGVSARTINLTGPTALVPVGIPAGVVGTAQKGPAFVPVTVPTIQDFIVSFGKTTDGAVNGPLATSEWLRNAQAATFLRILGIGLGAARTTSGQNRGKVSNAGFVIGDQQPQSTLSGALGFNTYAVTSSGADAGPLGRMYFLGAFMSQSNGSTWFSEAGLSGSGLPVVRGMIMAASGVVLTLSNSAGGTNSAPSTTLAAAGANITGFQTGSVVLSGSKQEFVMLLNGHRALDLSYPNVVTASFDPTAPNYFGSIFNKDPFRLEQAGYVMSNWWDIYSSVATVTGAGAVVSGGTGTERIAFLLTGSSTRNSGSTSAPNFENFEDRFRTARSPWVTSQLFGGKPQNLFKVHTLDDGAYSNGKIKISIENIAPSLSETYLYGKFDLLIRDGGDTDKSRAVLEQWRNLSLDPNADNFVGRVIGNYNTFYNFQASNGEQKIVVEGDYPNNSKYIRVEIASGVNDANVDSTALPMGFRGSQHLVVSGTSPMGAYTDATNLVGTNPWFKLAQPPVPMRRNVSKGASGNTVGDRQLYWGVQFEKVISISESNASLVPDDSLVSFAKYLPNFHTEWQNVVLRDNEDTVDTAANGILDADRFNNNLFSLEKIRVPYISASNLPDINNLDTWTYVRQGGITTDTVAFTRALTISDLEDPTVRQAAKFSFFVEGGFDGVRIFDRNTQYMNNVAVVQELSNGNRLLSNGPTVKAFERALSIMNDTSELDVQILTVPGIRHEFITDQALAVAENRFDAIYLMDIQEKDTQNNTIVGNDDQIVSVRNTVNSFRDRGLNSSFGAAYFPNVILRDSLSNVVREVAPSVAVLGAFSKNDAVAFPWFAPAGFVRGALDTTQEAAVKLSRSNMDDLYQVNINPLVAFPGSEGTVVWGQKTLYASPSALERVNVRRLLLSLRRQIRKVANRFLFEPNRESTLSRFQQLCQPILKKIQDQQGVESYLVKIDTTTTTQVDVENKTIRGKIFVVPVRTLEFLDLSFVLTNQGNFNIV